MTDLAHVMPACGHPRLILTRCAVLLACLALAACATAPPLPVTCQLEQDASFPVTYAGRRTPVITIDIQGKPERMMVDSGAAKSFLSVPAYLALPRRPRLFQSGLTGSGAGGNIWLRYYAVQDLYFGAVRLKGEQLIVSNAFFPKRGKSTTIDGLLGYDILQKFDIGLDLPEDRISLYALKQCNTTETPWLGDYAPVPFTRPDGNAPMITETVDNADLRVAIDTGAETSLLFQAALVSDRLELKPLPPNKALRGFGIGGRINIAAYRVDSISIGAETYTNPVILVDTTPQAALRQLLDGLLGEDYLATHRVFLSNSTDTAYLGLTVTPTLH